jgi:WD40 repeat protein
MDFSKKSYMSQSAYACTAEILKKFVKWMIFMKVEDAVKFIDELFESNPQNSKNALSNLDKIIIEGAWNNKKYAEIAKKSTYDIVYLRTAAGRLWQVIHSLIGSKVAVKKRNVKSLIEAAYLQRHHWKNCPDWRRATELHPSWPAHTDGIGGLAIRPKQHISDGIEDSAINPNEPIFASGSWDGSIHLWNLDTGKLLQALAAPEKKSDDFKDVAALAFTPDGNRLISASYDRTIKIWELNTGKLLATLRKDTDRPHRSFNLGSKVEALALSSDGQVLASGDFDNHVYLWDLQNPQSIHKFQTSSEVLSLAFSPNSWKLCCGCLDGTVYVWDLQKSLELKFTASKGFISSIVTSPDSQKIYSGDEYGAITIWDINTGVKIGTWPGQHKSAILTLAFHPQSPNVLASSGYDKKIIFWNLNSGRPLHKLSTDQGAVTAIFFNKDGNILVAGDEFGNITLWQTTNQFSSSL